MARETEQTIKDKFNQRAWDQTSQVVRDAKIQLFVRGESLGERIPDGVKKAVYQRRIWRKIWLVVLMTGFVLVAA